MMKVQKNVILKVFVHPYTFTTDEWKVGINNG